METTLRRAQFGLQGQTGAYILQGSTIGASIATPAIASSLFGTASFAIPVVGAAIAGITLAIGAWMNRKGPKQKVWTTQIVNEAEPHLRDNLAAYVAGPHTASSQQQALANFDAVWQQVVDTCSQAQFGEPGERCVNDRKRGSTKGYDWFVLYRDPIEHDAHVISDEAYLVSIGQGTPDVGSGQLINPATMEALQPLGQFITPPVLIALALIVVGVSLS